MRIELSHNWILARYESGSGGNIYFTTVANFPNIVTAVDIELLSGTYRTMNWEGDKSEPFTLEHGEIRHVEQPGVQLL